MQGLQSQERHLFLFNDLLLIAKARSGGNFKLKDKVRVSHLWLATCVDDVAEVAKSRDTSFVIGWPTTNVVASFRFVLTFYFFSFFEQQRKFLRLRSSNNCSNNNNNSSSLPPL